MTNLRFPAVNSNSFAAEMNENCIKLLPQGGLITESFFHFGSDLKKEMPNLNPERYLPKEKMLRVVILHLFGEST